MNQRMVTHQLAFIGVPPRAKRIQPPRYRLQVTGITEVVQPVKIRHASQNLGTAVSETPPVQSPRV
jgi:hypothetical protein